jgi:hypothetical protein
MAGLTTAHAATTAAIPNADRTRAQGTISNLLEGRYLPLCRAGSPRSRHWCWERPLIPDFGAECVELMEIRPFSMALGGFGLP